MMRRAFVIGVLGLVLLEVANVYFIMPFPGSQRIRSLEAAYLVHSWRWPVRVVFGTLMVAGLAPAWRMGGWRRWLVPAILVTTALIVYLVNFRMAADQMFRQPTTLLMVPADRNRVALDRLVVGIEIDGLARAYPLQFIGYHHQVRDTLAGREILVSYCTVCRTGRIFSPEIDGRSESFRLVGMDRFNAMLEDATTRSWWRQANGEAVVGPRKGKTLTEFPTRQVTLRQWLALYPASLVMQADPAFLDRYPEDRSYEDGTSRRELTGTDTLSWRDKSWVVGITQNGRSKAYDWNRLRREGVINDVVGGQPIVLALGPDRASFFAFARPDTAQRFVLRGDSLVSATASYSLNGRGPAGNLTAINASQEFWHSWRTFQPATDRY